MTKLNRIFAIAAALATTAGTGLRAEAPGDAPPSVRVHYADLDLSQETGRAILEQRIRRAADHVCNQRGSIDLVSQLTAGQCRRLTVRSTDKAVRVAVMKSAHRLASR
jgi:UrcA family protein